jgi:uncharacterized membrane protein
MKIFSHPLHMMLIHFPTALLPMDVLLSVFAYYNKDSGFLPAAFYCLAGGVALGALAIITGLIDLLLIPKDKKQAMGTALIHGFMNAIIVILFGIFAYRAWQLYPQMNMPLLSTLLIKAVLIIVLFVGNYLGGKLILQHHIGVKNI